MYLESREDEVSEHTHRAHGYRLQHLPRWADTRDDIETTADLTGRTLFEYRQWRRKDGDLNLTSLHTQLSTVRVWLKWLQSINAARDGIHERLDMPTLHGQDKRTFFLDEDRASDILNYLSKFEYASFQHITMLLLWRTGIRIGALHSLDVDDFDNDNRLLHVQHRPESGTPLKNGVSGERAITLRYDTCEVLEDYIKTNRPEVVDGQREPLIATTQGRAAKTTIRRTVYRCTQPCMLSGECPHGRALDECPAQGYTDNTDCPDILSPHDIRRGAITHFRKKGIPQNAVKGRCNVSEKVMDEVYDRRTNSEKAENRRRYFE